MYIPKGCSVTLSPPYLRFPTPNTTHQLGTGSQQGPSGDMWVGSHLLLLSRPVKRVIIHIFGYISLSVWGTTSREKLLCQWKELLRPGMCVCPLDSNVRSLVILTVFPNIWRLAGLGSDFTMQSPFGVIWQFVSSTAPLGLKGRCNDTPRKATLGPVSGRTRIRFWCLIPGLE